MFNGKEVVAVIPVRGGSKGIPGKNLLKLGNETLLERAIKLGRANGRIDRVVVSTDDPQMYEISRRHDASLPALRPAHLASDQALTVDVVLHALDQLHIVDAYVLLLQVTSPLRTRADLEAVFRELEANLARADAVASVTRQSDPHPNKMQKIEDGYLHSYLGGEAGVPRQSLPEVYRFNGAFYLIDAGILRSQHTFLPARTIPYLMPPERSVNLDSPLDLYLLQALVEKNGAILDE